MKNVLLLVLLSGGAHAQGVAVKSSDESAKVAPPKAQVIEEEADISVDDAKVVPAVKKESQGASKKVSDPENGGDASGSANSSHLKKENGGEPSAEMPPLSELKPLIPEPKKTVNEGIEIQVEKVRGASRAGSSTDKVKVTSPWPAKPLDSPPLGWKFIPAPDGISPYRTTVKLGDAQSVTLSITPYVLVPVSDGRNVIRIAEPGYQPEQGYLQQDTIGSILKESTQELEHHEQRTAAAIQRLQQLLSSLPQS